MTETNASGAQVPCISLLADHVLVADTLPDGIGVLPDEAGKPGPWYGVRMPDGSNYGWYRVKAGAEHEAMKVWRAHEANAQGHGSVTRKEDA